jgi:hypothetical protein
VVSDITWSVPGLIVKDYTANVSKAKLTFLDSDALSKPQISFYWTQPNPAYTVKVDFTRTQDGLAVKCHKEIVLSVVAPAIVTMWPTMIGKPTAINGTSIKLKGSTDLAGAGIAFKAKVTDPAGLVGLTNVGQWQFVQTITHYAYGQVRSTGKCSADIPTISGPLCDNNYPYGTGPFPTPVNGVAQYTDDSPELIAPANLVNYIAREDYFFMYVMYKPPVYAGQQAIWIGLAVLPWTFIFCANSDGANWTVVTNGSVQNGWTPVLSNPEWNGTYVNGFSTDTPIACPGPCVAPPAPPPPE